MFETFNSSSFIPIKITGTVDSPVEERGSSVSKSAVIQKCHQPDAVSELRCPAESLLQSLRFAVILQNRLYGTHMECSDTRNAMVTQPVAL